MLNRNLCTSKYSTYQKQNSFVDMDPYTEVWTDVGVFTIVQNAFLLPLESLGLYTKYT